MIRVCFAYLAVGALLVLLAGTASGEDAKTPHTDLYGDPLPKGAIARLGMLRFVSTHEDLAFSSDGKHLISCGCDGQVRIWNAATGQLRRRWQRLPGKPREDQELFDVVALAADGALVAVWDRENVSVYETTTGNEVSRLPAVDSFDAPALTFSADGKRLLVQRQEHRLGPPIQQLWDVRSDNKHPVLKTLSCPFGCRLSQAVFAPDGKRLAAIDGATLRLWDTTTGKELTQADENFKVAPPLAFSPDGKMLAIQAPSDGWLYLVNAATLKKTATLKPPTEIKKGTISSHAFSPDGRQLAVMYHSEGEKDHGMFLWDVADLKVSRRLPKVRGVDRLVFSPDGEKLAGWAGSHEVRLWETASGRPLHQQPNHEQIVRALATSPDGKMILSGDRGQMLRLWDADTGKPLRTLEAAEPDITHCLFSPDGKRMISVCGASPEREPGSAVLQMWDVALGKEVRRFTVIQPVQQVHAVGMSEGGKRLMAAVEVGKAETTTQLYVWNTDSGKLLSQRSYKTEEHTRIRPSGMWWCKDHAAFAPDGERMSVWRGIEDVASGCLQAILPTEAGTPVVFSPDGRLLAAVILQPIPNSPTRFSEKGLCLLETATGEEILHWNIGSIDYVGFTPDGRGVVVADRERLSVWDTTTGARLHQMAWPRGEEAGEEPSAYALAVLPGGRAATSRMNGHILVWDLAASTWPTRRSTHDLERATLDALWSDLSDEARKANRAITTLAASPAQTVPFLQDRLPPLAALNAKRIDRLLADLASDSFAVREAASRQLASMRYRAEPTLRKALENKPSLEVRRRIESILAGPRRPPTEDLRRLRAIAVLERIGTPEARRILEKLSEAEAQAALRRLQRR